MTTAEIAPLTPLRYDLDKVKLADVVAPPYDVIGAEERAALAKRSEHNVVRLELPEGDGDAKYTNAAKLLSSWRESKVLIRDEEPAYYKYEQTFAPPADPGAPKRTRTGFLGLVRLVPFDKRIVLPHERTLSGPKEDRFKLFRATQASVSPGFMLYRDPKRALDHALAGGSQLARFSTPDGIEHVLTKISDKDAVRAITKGVGESTLLIADGHHRYETALRYSTDVSGKEHGAHKYFMVFFANGDDPNLVVYPTHRHVHGLAGFSFADFVTRAKELFDVTALTSTDDVLPKLEAAGTKGPSFVACAKDGSGALLTLKSGADLAKHPVLGALVPELRRTDVAILHGAILESMLGITKEAQAAKTNLWYPQDARTATQELRGGKGDVLFLMNATPVADVRSVAEAGEVMPQKSTFFYPKVLTGLAIHTLETDRSVS
jgi:uncharacterized protein (DUF1015 family)